MKLESMGSKKTPGYPSYRDHVVTRRSISKALAIGLAGAVAGGCFGSGPAGTPPPPEPPKTMGEPPAVTNMATHIPAPVEPQRVRGEMVAPEPPPKLAGDIAIPDPPKRDDEN